MTYRSVEEAFVVHGQVEFGLDALDGHHSKPHWNQVKHGCTKTHKEHTGINKAGSPQLYQHPIWTDDTSSVRC